MEEKQARRSSNKDRKEQLLKRLSEWIDGGDTPEQAIEKLTLKQYDFLVEQGVDLDALLLTPEQLKNLHKAVPRERRKSPEGYNKKYPEEKQHLFQCIRTLFEGMGAEVIPREKENFRDLDFTYNGTHYRVVFSNPRT